MTYEPRPYLPAVVSPLASLLLTKPEILAALEPWLLGMERSPLEGNRRAARETRAGLASMRESGRQWLVRQGVGSDDGTSEPSVVAGGAQSSTCPPPESGLGAREVAERWEVSTEYVTRLCRNKRLSAVQVGRTWVIDKESVTEYEAQRRPVA